MPVRSLFIINKAGSLIYYDVRFFFFFFSFFSVPSSSSSPTMMMMMMMMISCKSRFIEDNKYIMSPVLIFYYYYFRKQAFPGSHALETNDIIRVGSTFDTFCALIKKVRSLSLSLSISSTLTHIL
jgi:hypothetical protein